MNNHAPSSEPHELHVRPVQSVLQWQLTRGTERVLCRIDRDLETGAYAVALVACKSLRRASAGTFRAVKSALRRHADVVNQLRSTGWTIAGYTR